MLESHVESLIKEHESEMLTNISSISGIGKKTAMMLISNTYAFKSFDNYKQVTAFSDYHQLNVLLEVVSEEGHE